LTSEINFLLAAVAAARDDSQVARARELASIVEWKRVFALAKIHCVTPIICRFIAENGGAATPESVKSTARKQFLELWRRNTKFARTLVEIARVIEAEGIPVIALKGPALAIQTWGDPVMREYSDLDLLVKPHDVPRVAKLLADRGYRARRYVPNTAEGGSFFDFESEFTTAGNGVAIDLHVKLAPSYFPTGIDSDRLWLSSVRVEIEGSTVATLNPTDSARFVAAHAAKHGWRSFGFVSDFAALESSPDLDWPALLAGATNQSGRMIRLAVILAEEMCGARFPAEIDAAARRDSDVTRLARKIRARMFDATADGLSLFHDWVVPLRSLERTQDRLRYAAGRAFRPTVEDREFIALPRKIYWAYYLTRPLRMAGLHGHRLFRSAPLGGANQ